MELQQRVAARPDGGANQLMGEVQATAELLWTSDLVLEGLGDDYEKEFCSLLNEAIRDDNAQLAGPTASLSLGINALCLEARSDTALPFPPSGTVFRGTGFDDAHRDFFVVEKQYR